MLEKYKIAYEGGQGEIVEKKSRFIATIRPVKTEEEALSFIAEMNKKYWDASHNCSAYVIGERNEIQRCSDDGEPGQTAGRPMLDVLLGEEIHDVCAVVTRYFGGILLGAGGLVRAYSHGAKLAVDAAVRRHMNPCTVLELCFGYDWYGKISYLLPRYNAQTLESDFGAEVRLKLMITSDKVPAFQKEITELTAASVVPRPVEEICADLE